MLKYLLSLIKNVFREWNKDHAQRMGAALAFYTVFSLAPLLILVIGVLGIIFRASSLEGYVIGEFSSLLGPGSEDFLRGLVYGSQDVKTGILASILGCATLFAGAAGVFGQLKGALNTILGEEKAKEKGVWKFFRKNIASFSMVLATSFLLLVSLLISAVISALGALLSPVFSFPLVLWEVGNTVVSLLATFLLFALILRFVPDKKFPWPPTLISAGVTTILFTIGKILIGIYLGQSSLTSTYATAGSLIIILFWTYYSAQILLLGAELLKILSRESSYAK